MVHATELTGAPVRLLRCSITSQSEEVYIIAPQSCTILLMVAVVIASHPFYGCILTQGALLTRFMDALLTQGAQESDTTQLWWRRIREPATHSI